MVAQVLANLSPAMIPDYAQAPAVYVETDGSSEYLNRDICQPEGFDAYGYPSELFKLDMERLGMDRLRAATGRL